MKKILVVFGTRPEAIKMCPLVKELRKNSDFDVKVCVTGQHKELLEDVLSTFNIVPDYNLNIMKENQSLFEITSNILLRIRSVLLETLPDIVLVHGDTSTTFVTGLACFYERIPVGHVEAGLRTYNIDSPFPEEFNRQATSIISKLHFAPTERAAENLLNEKIPKDRVFVTGNTVIDALKYTVKDNYSHPVLDWVSNHKMILLTAHRRENHGKPLENIFNAVLTIVEKYPDIRVVYPVHPNPKVKEVAERMLGNHQQIKLIPPLDVIDFHNIVAKSYFVMSDSGGIQEEAPSLGKPVLVLRDTTERPEGVAAGTLKLVGTETESIVQVVDELLNNHEVYEEMSKAKNPYGDGNTSELISRILENAFAKKII